MTQDVPSDPQAWPPLSQRRAGPAPDAEADATADAAEPVVSYDDEAPPISAVGRMGTESSNRRRKAGSELDKPPSSDPLGLLLPEPTQPSHLLTKLLSEGIDQSITQQALLTRAWNLAEKEGFPNHTLCELGDHIRYMEHLRSSLISVLTRLPTIELVGSRLLKALEACGALASYELPQDPLRPVRRRRRYAVVVRMVQNAIWDLNAGERRLFDAEIADVSEAGMGFYCNRALPLGALVMLPFMLGNVAVHVWLRVRHAKAISLDRWKVGGMFTYSGDSSDELDATRLDSSGSAEPDQPDAPSEYGRSTGMLGCGLGSSSDNQLPSPTPPSDR